MSCLYDCPPIAALLSLHSLCCLTALPLKHSCCHFLIAMLLLLLSLSCSHLHSPIAALPLLHFVTAFSLLHLISPHCCTPITSHHTALISALLLPCSPLLCSHYHFLTATFAALLCCTLVAAFSLPHSHCCSLIAAFSLPHSQCSLLALLLSLLF